jgi:hypothetical protein
MRTISTACPRRRCVQILQRVEKWLAIVPGNFCVNDTKPRRFAPGSNRAQIDRNALDWKGTRLMPRRSADFHATMPFATPSAPVPRLKPPETMSEAARKIFLGLIVGSRADQFRATDLPLLVRYCEAHALAERAESAIAKRPLVKGKASPWNGILSQANKTASALAMRLRLSPQARAPNNPTRRTAPMSYYERVGLEQQLGDDETEVQ